MLLHRTCPGDGRTNGRTDGRTDGRTEGRTDKRTNGRTEGRTDGRTDGRADGRADGRTDGRTGGRTGGRSGFLISQPKGWALSFLAAISLTYKFRLEGHANIKQHGMKVCHGNNNRCEHVFAFGNGIEFFKQMLLAMFLE